jgi:hypothetical protein
MTALLHEYYTLRFNGRSALNARVEANLRAVATALAVNFAER